MPACYDPAPFQIESGSSRYARARHFQRCPARAGSLRQTAQTVLIYGVVGGLLILALKLVEYRFLVVEHSIEIYGALVAALFAALGIWLGQTLTRPKTEVEVHEVVVKEVVPAVAAVAPAGLFVVNAARVQAIGLTPRELEILGLIAGGLSNREIATRLFVNFMPDFGDKYTALVIEKARAAGESQASIDAKTVEMKSLMAMLANLLPNAAMTFTEPFPIGLAITLISAAVLRKK